MTAGAGVIPNGGDGLCVAVGCKLFVRGSPLALTNQLATIPERETVDCKQDELRKAKGYDDKSQLPAGDHGNDEPANHCDDVLQHDTHTLTGHTLHKCRVTGEVGGQLARAVFGMVKPANWLTQDGLERVGTQTDTRHGYVGLLLDALLFALVVGTTHARPAQVTLGRRTEAVEHRVDVGKGAAATGPRLDHLQLLLLLLLDETKVVAAQGHEVVVRAAFHDRSILDKDDLVDVSDGRQSVSD
ncbi:hypothetical protein DFA_05470 [Cavenderia fasciculata]|uniref:Uncharacterized protein n=1 Tax=Cavenderia fasciculata TaxID=261658 RepID=F4PLB6_CACFS|nr:uncharacterized protein DFA_05470 [Cavenderia fasciculata]EGG23338.1 hypothetical protein DFA_05470 [Cavenderia fasciculata]|eukprot:XP_004361189.1 hypothetical protein DFA_05470 [Cavenderia fasciculata]